MKNCKIIFLLMLLCGVSEFVSAATYYVSQSAGADSNTGLLRAHAWKTITRVNHSQLLPGDSVLFQCNDRWQEQLICKMSGDSQNPIVYTSYGEGRQPRLERLREEHSVCIYVSGANYCTFKDIEISNSEYGFILNSRGSAFKRGITIENCYFHDVRLNREFYRDSLNKFVCGRAIGVGSDSAASTATGNYTNIVVRNCISVDCDQFFSRREASALGKVLIDGCTMKGHSANTVLIGANNGLGVGSEQIVRNCVFMDNGGKRAMLPGGADLYTCGSANDTIEYCEFGNRNAFPGDPDGCAIDFECGTMTNNIVRHCDIHGNRSGALLIMPLDGFYNSGMVDCLLRYNGREYKRYEIYNGSNSITGPIQNNTYYLLGGTTFMSNPGAFTISNNIAGSLSTVATPTASLSEGVYATTISVTLTCATAGAIIHYTTDGSYPKVSSPVYSAPITIDRTIALNAKAFKEGMEQSYSLSNVYTITSDPPVLVAAASTLGDSTLFVRFDRPIMPSNASDTANFNLNSGLQIKRTKLLSDSHIVALILDRQLTEGDTANIVYVKNVLGVFGTGVCFDSMAVTLFHLPACIGHWPLDEKSGSIAHDKTCNNRNGTSQGALVWTIGKKRGALSFNGTSGAVSFAPASLSNITNNFTIAFWAFPSATRNVTTQANGGASGTSDQRYAFFPTQGGIYGTNHAGAGISVGTNGISVFEHAPGYLPSLLVYNSTITGWVHIAVVYSNKQPKLYLNGNLVATGLTSTMTVHPSLTMSGSYGWYQGSLDEVYLFSTVLTPENIAQLAVNGQSTSSESIGKTDNGFAFSVSPNPFNPIVSIDYQLPLSLCSQPVTVSIYRAGGQLVKVFSGRAGVSTQRLLWNAAGESSGIYILSLEVGTNKITRPITLIK
ncbi:MAG: chitobiase/beta-hexosaminidase C-terminal domain-containing protein [Fibrobacteres bacterium]|nr:chitobiase/beta-hexosaminidase C-terminal domain-containing protein [Fibrobacterota bacterium]